MLGVCCIYLVRDLVGYAGTLRVCRPTRSMVSRLTYGESTPRTGTTNGNRAEPYSHIIAHQPLNFEDGCGSCGFERILGGRVPATDQGEMLS